MTFFNYKKTYTRKKGFSLIEIMVAVSLFTVVMTISVGALLSLIDADRKAQALKSVMNNLNFALDNMSRSIRLGSVYHCSNNAQVPGNLDTAKNCSNGGALIAFEPFNGSSATSADQVIYRFTNSRIEKSSDGGTTFIPVTASEVTITNMEFFVVGAKNNDTLQPRVVMVLQGSAGVSAKAQTTFNLQTTVSQRTLDL